MCENLSKMKRRNGSQAPELFEDLTEGEENTVAVRVLNKKKSSELKTHAP